jgi:hypothetical protein
MNINDRSRDGFYAKYILDRNTDRSDSDFIDLLDGIYASRNVSAEAIDFLKQMDAMHDLYESFDNIYPIKKDALTPQEFHRKLFDLFTKYRKLNILNNMRGGSKKQKKSKKRKTRR